MLHYGGEIMSGQAERVAWLRWSKIHALEEGHALKM